MKVRETHVSDSDKWSAKVFFDALLAFWDLKKGAVLDAFARNGQLTLNNYAGRVGDTTAWELGEEHRTALERFDLYDLQIGDSYALAKQCEDRFDMIVVDTPQGAHKDSEGKVHFEHFDFLHCVLGWLLKDRGVVVLYVNKVPYDKNREGSHGYDEYAEYDFPAWMRARSDFYGTGCECRVTEDQALAGYRRVIEHEGWELKNTLLVPCFSDVPNREPYSFRVGLEVQKGK
jgi:hypothetical protein